MWPAALVLVELPKNRNIKYILPIWVPFPESWLGTSTMVTIFSLEHMVTLGKKEHIFSFASLYLHPMAKGLECMEGWDSQGVAQDANE